MYPLSPHPTTKDRTSRTPEPPTKSGTTHFRYRHSGSVRTGVPRGCGSFHSLVESTHSSSPRGPKAGSNTQNHKYRRARQVKESPPINIVKREVKRLSLLTEFSDRTVYKHIPSHVTDSFRTFHSVTVTLTALVSSGHGPSVITVDQGSDVWVYRCPCLVQGISALDPTITRLPDIQPLTRGKDFYTFIFTIIIKHRVSFVLTSNLNRVPSRKPVRTHQDVEVTCLLFVQVPG